jgi:aspartate aminotransferase-like enzyme
MLKKRLYTPGPTMVPEKVMLAMAEPVIHHRAPEFIELFKSVNENLKYLFQTKQPVVTLTSSGTGAMQAAVTSIMSSKGKALTVNAGKFGERWGNICKAFKLPYEDLKVEWGDAVTAEMIEKKIKADPSITAVFTTYTETSTGALTDIQSIAAVTRKTDVLLVVDAITACGSHELRFDDWGIDIAITGSQKGLMLPPGLAFAVCSPKAVAAMEKADCPEFYFSMKKAIKTVLEDQTPWTPAVTLIVGLKAALDMIKSEGIENIWKRHEQNANACRNACKAMNLELFCKKPSNVLTVANIPESVGAEKVVKKMMSAHGMRVTGGQDHLKGKILRISHLGYVDQFDIISCISGLEYALVSLGYKMEIGVGVAAAARSFSA